MGSKMGFVSSVVWVVKFCVLLVRFFDRKYYFKCVILEVVRILGIVIIVFLIL